jgi:magnesium-transporting ATPase (P-type)
MEISEEILKSINNNEILKLEHQHVNTLIQQNEAYFAKTMRWFIGVGMALISASLSVIVGFSMNFIKEEEKYSIERIITASAYFNISMRYATFLTFILFIFIVYFTLMQRKDLKTYKEKIILLQNHKLAI